MGLSSRGNFIDSGMEAYHWSSWNSSSPTALVRSERLCSACTVVRSGMGRGSILYMPWKMRFSTHRMATSPR